MILEMIAGSSICYLATAARAATGGTSQEARIINNRLICAIDDLRRPRFYEERHSSAKEEVVKVVEESKFDDWDGWGISPVKEVTERLAIDFLDTLDETVPSPSVNSDSDGHIVFEWTAGPRSVLTVSIGPEAELHYAVLLGQLKEHGRGRFKNGIPADISVWIPQVLGLHV